MRYQALYMFSNLTVLRVSGGINNYQSLTVDTATGPN